MDLVDSWTVLRAARPWLAGAVIVIAVVAFPKPMQHAVEHWIEQRGAQITQHLSDALLPTLADDAQPATDDQHLP